MRAALRRVAYWFSGVPRATWRTRYGVFRVSVCWTNWFVGFWYWPVAKDRTFGVRLGPAEAYWSRRD